MGRACVLSRCDSEGACAALVFLLLLLHSLHSPAQLALCRSRCAAAPAGPAPELTWTLRLNNMSYDSNDSDAVTVAFRGTGLFSKLVSPA